MHDHVPFLPKTLWESLFLGVSFKNYYSPFHVYQFPVLPFVFPSSLSLISINYKPVLLFPHFLLSVSWFYRSAVPQVVFLFQEFYRFPVNQLNFPCSSVPDSADQLFPLFRCLNRFAFSISGCSLPVPLSSFLCFPDPPFPTFFLNFRFLYLVSSLFHSFIHWSSLLLGFPRSSIA